MNVIPIMRYQDAPRAIVIDDADVGTHFARSKAAGAEIVHEVIEPPHGGQLYTCLDLEGHGWNFGSYDPWQEV